MSHVPAPPLPSTPGGSPSPYGRSRLRNMMWAGAVAALVLGLFAHISLSDPVRAGNEPAAAASRPKVASPTTTAATTDSTSNTMRLVDDGLAMEFIPHTQAHAVDALANDPQAANRDDVVGGSIEALPSDNPYFDFFYEPIGEADFLVSFKRHISGIPADVDVELQYRWCHRTDGCGIGTIHVRAYPFHEPIELWHTPATVGPNWSKDFYLLPRNGGRLVSLEVTAVEGAGNGQDLGPDVETHVDSASGRYSVKTGDNPTPGTYTIRYRVRTAKPAWAYDDGQWARFMVNQRAEGLFELTITG